MARPQRVLPRRRSGVPHILHQQPWRRGDGDHLELPRHHAARPSGDLGGLARGLPPDAAVQVVELARQLRHRGLARPEVGQGVRRWRSRLPKARRRGESELKKGDHFAAFEQPGLSVQELREGSAESAEPVLRSTDTRFCAKSQLSRFAVWKARKDAFWASGRRFGSNPVGHRADKSREQWPPIGSPSRGTVIPHEIQPGTSILTLRLVARDLLQFRDTAVVAQSSYYLQAVQAPLDGPA